MKEFFKYRQFKYREQSLNILYSKLYRNNGWIKTRGIGSFTIKKEIKKKEKNVIAKLQKSFDFIV